jgi:hypothetical protein
MPRTVNGPFTVVAGDVATPVNVLAGDTVQTIAGGLVSFARVVGRTFSADGEDWRADNDFPAPALRKHSLIARFGGGPWHQGGIDAQIPVPLGESGQLILRTNDHDDWLWDNDLGWTVTIVHTRPDPPPTPPPGTSPTEPRLSIPTVEVVQSIQSWNNTVPLILGKRTLVRVYVDSGIRDGSDAGSGANCWGNVTGHLEIVNALDGSMISTLNVPTMGPQSIVARPESEINRGQLAQSLNFELPTAALTVPVLRLRAVVRVPGTAYEAMHTTTRAFIPRGVQPVLPILINLETNGVGPPSEPQFRAALLERTLPRLPFAEDGFLVHPSVPWTTRNDLTQEDHWGLLLQQMATIKLISSTRVDGIRCGVVSDTPGGWVVDVEKGRVINGIATTRIHGSRIATFITNVARPTTFAHEMSHCFGVGHSNCTGEEQGLDGRRIPGHIDEIGFNTETQTVVQRGTDELMGYCSQDRWPDTRTYEILMREGVI